MPCFVHDLSPGLDKLSLRFIKCVFVRCSRKQKGHWCYYPSTGKYLVSADVTFFESVSYFSTQVSVTISETIPPSLSVPLPTPASTISSQVMPAEPTAPPVSKPDRDFRYVYTYRPKVPASKPVRLTPLRWTVFLHRQLLSLILIFLLPFEKVNGLALITLF